MLNYIALYLIMFLREGPWRDPSNMAFPQIATIGENARLGEVFGVHAGWIVALVLVVLVFVYMKYTKHGYEISVVGESQNTARYAGMNVSKIVLRTMFISGAICGLAGMVQVSGNTYNPVSYTHLPARGSGKEKIGALPALSINGRALCTSFRDRPV